MRYDIDVGAGKYITIKPTNRILFEKIRSLFMHMAILIKDYEIP